MQPIVLYHCFHNILMSAYYFRHKLPCSFLYACNFAWSLNTFASNIASFLLPFFANSKTHIHVPTQKRLNGFYSKIYFYAHILLAWLIAQLLHHSMQIACCNNDGMHYFIGYLYFIVERITRHVTCPNIVSMSYESIQPKWNHEECVKIFSQMKFLKVSTLPWYHTWHEKGILDVVQSHYFPCNTSIITL